MPISTQGVYLSICTKEMVGEKPKYTEIYKSELFQ